MAETHVIEYEITEDQAAAAATAVLEATSPAPGTVQPRSIALKALLYSALAMGAVGLGLWMNQPWWFFVPAVLMLGVSVLVAGILGLHSASAPRYRRHLDAALREAFRRLESPHIRWTVTGETLVVESGRDRREFSWTDVKDLFLTGTFWILKVENAPTMLLLADRIPDRTARFLLLRAREVGATIRVAGGGTAGPDGDG
jgi:hypothetical protein